MPKLSTHKRAFGRVLRRLRKQRGLSQRELANQVPCDRQQIGNWERGENSPGLDLLLKLTDALGISISELFRLVEEELPRKQPS